MVNKERLVNTFLEIVKVNSQTKNERMMADYLKGKLSGLGLAVEEDNAGEAFGGNAGNVLARLEGKADKNALLLSAHMDRVAPGENIQPVVEGDLIKSDGDTILGADDGAGLAIILEVLQVLRENNLQHGLLEVVFTVAEEGGLNGSKALDVDSLAAKQAVIFDSSGDAGIVINQAPAQDEIIARIYGQAAHAGVAPEKGINAIVVAAKAIGRMQLGRLDEETTTNIGVITGGKATNIVPDFVEVRGEARSFREEKLQKATESMKAAFNLAAAEENGRVEIEVKRLYAAYHHPEDHKLLQLVKKAGKAVGLKIVIQASGGGSDANILNGKGIDAINLGVGNGEAHTPQEFQKISELLKAAELAVKIVEFA
ncbi:MAG: Carboxypeptidase G2 [Syntrophomonadaceae bacterium]|nr:Carboxypeptidase G2 [Bacillota bacterium]